MKILVTGASGFVGKKLIQRLKQKGKEVIETSGNSKALPIDLRNAQDVRSLIEKVQPRVIFHMGAYVDLSRTYRASKKCVDVNILGTLNLLESLRQYPPKRMIFISTEDVYGIGHIPYKEDQITYPPSGYAISKIAGESFAKIYARDIGFELLIFRIGAMYGPCDKPHRLIPQIITKAINGEDIFLNSGKKARDYVYIDDVIEALIKALETKMSKKIDIINIGGGIHYKLIDVVNLIVNELQSSSKIIIDAIPDRKGESGMWKMDITKAKKLLSWEPKINLRDGLRETIAFYKK